MSPNGTTPVLKDGDGGPLGATGAILRYRGARLSGGHAWVQ